MCHVDQHNFDWGITERKVVVFIPNFKRKNLLIPTLRRFKTDLPRDDWVILVVNDGPHEDLSDLSEFNVAYFTFMRKPIKERNGCMIRNYVLRRIRSEIMTTRDPEIFVEGEDHLKIIANMDDIVYRPGSMTELCEQDTTRIINNPHIDLTSLQAMRHWDVTSHNYQAFHAGFAIRVNRLFEMGGYDEDFAGGYGWEDVNLLERIKDTDVKIQIDPQVRTYHIWHPMMRRFHNTIQQNGLIYKMKKKQCHVIANKNKRWGMGS